MLIRTITLTILATALTALPARSQSGLNIQSPYSYGTSTYGQSNGPVHVNPYTRNDGASVQGHYRSAPDGNPYNNWSTQGNTNPYTGRQGTKSPYGY